MDLVAGLGIRGSVPVDSSSIQFVIVLSGFSVGDRAKTVTDRELKLCRLVPSVLLY